MEKKKDMQERIKRFLQRKNNPKSCPWCKITEEWAFKDTKTCNNCKNYANNKTR